jgi:putative membrane protein
VPRMTSKRHLQLHFRLRPFFVRWLVSALTLAVTVLVVPHIFFSGDFPILSYIIISGVFGLLNAFIKPLFQLLLLPLIFVSYGLIIVVINTVVLYLLSAIFPDRFHVEHILWAIVGGIVSGLVFTLLENVFGLAPPIMVSAPEDVQHEIDEAGPGLVESGILKVASHGTTAPMVSAEQGGPVVAAAVIETMDAAVAQSVAAPVAGQAEPAAEAERPPDDGGPSQEASP